MDNKFVAYKEMRWADIEDDDCLTCEKCGIKEYTFGYCVNCVNNMVQLMSLFQNFGDLSESAKERLYCQIMEEHRSACAPHPGKEDGTSTSRQPRPAADPQSDKSPGESRH